MGENTEMYFHLYFYYIKKKDHKTKFKNYCTVIKNRV